MHPHAANLRIAQEGRITVSFCDASCFDCYDNNPALSEKNSSQVLRIFERRAPSLLHALFLSRPASIDKYTLSDCTLPIHFDENSNSRHLGLSNVLKELNIHELNVTPQLNHSLLGVIDRCLEPFSRDAHDLWRAANMRIAVERTANFSLSMRRPVVPRIAVKHAANPGIAVLHSANSRVAVQHATNRRNLISRFADVSSP